MKRPSSIEKETWACMTREERMIAQHEATRSVLRGDAIYAAVDGAVVVGNYYGSAVFSVNDGAGVVREDDEGDF